MPRLPNMQLPNKSLEFLRDILAAPGWVKGDSPAKKAKMVYLAGKMLCDILPEPVKGADTELCKEFSLDAKHMEACKMAVTFFAEEDRVPKAGGFLNILIDTFKVLDD